MANAQVKHLINLSLRQSYMNTIEQLSKTLLPALEMTGIKQNEYLIVGSAGEFIAGFAKKFGDVDILVNPETFQRLVDNSFVWYHGDELETTVRIIRIGLLDIIEHHGEWLDKARSDAHNHPILTWNGMVDWRIYMGRPKDQLRAWQLNFAIYERARSVLKSDPPLIMLAELKDAEEQMFAYQKQLMEMNK